MTTYAKYYNENKRYLILEDERVWDTEKQVFLRPSIQGNHGGGGGDAGGNKGYIAVSLYIDGTQKRRDLHRLIGIALIPNPEMKRIVDHILERLFCKNTLDNLQWATDSENRRKAIAYWAEQGEEAYAKFVASIPEYRATELARLRARNEVETTLPADLVILKANEFPKDRR